MTRFLVLAALVGIVGGCSSASSATNEDPSCPSAIKYPCPSGYPDRLLGDLPAPAPQGSYAGTCCAVDDAGMQGACVDLNDGGAIGVASSTECVR